jgi:hypothetical protein
LRRASASAPWRNSEACAEKWSLVQYFMKADWQISSIWFLIIFKINMWF